MSPNGHPALRVAAFPMARGRAFSWHSHPRHQLAWTDRGVLEVATATDTWVLPPTRAPALCPLLLVYSLLNWDLLAILLMLLGWRAWTRDRYCAAAIWLALGAFAKLYPAFLLVFCLVELASRWRSGLASTRDVARFVAAAAAVATIVNVPFILIAFHTWLYFWS